jgi:hypothetical protein
MNRNLISDTAQYHQKSWEKQWQMFYLFNHFTRDVHEENNSNTIILTKGYPLDTTRHIIIVTTSTFNLVLYMSLIQEL